MQIDIFQNVVSMRKCVSPDLFQVPNLRDVYEYKYTCSEYEYKTYYKYPLTLMNNYKQTWLKYKHKSKCKQQKTVNMC